MLSGTTSTRDTADGATSTSRRSALHDPTCAGIVAAECNSTGERTGQLDAVGDERGAGADQQLLLSGRQQ